MEDVWMDFPDGTAGVLKQVLACEEGELFIRRRAHGYVIENRFESAFEYDLTLLGGSGLPEECDGWSLCPGELRREGEGYALTATAEDPNGEGWQEVTLTFGGAQAEVWAIRADLQLWHARPWMQLSTLAYAIVRKAECFPELTNDRERALLPLLNELGQLNHWGLTDPGGFPELKKRFPPELIPWLERVEAGRTWEQNVRRSDRLQRILNRGNYEKLWLGLWDEAAETQMDYPDRNQAHPELESQVTSYLHARGYEGEWPDYVKRRTIEKTVLARSYGRDHLVRKGTDAVFYIRCRSNGFEGKPYLAILCATELSNGGEPKGFDSCRFDGGGRCFLSAVSTQGALEDRLALAVKKAELRPLTKQERQTDGQISALSVFFWTFLLAGGFFAICMTLGMAALSLVLTVLLQGPSSVPGMFRELPWLPLFAGSWLLSGGTIGAIMAYFVRK